MGKKGKLEIFKTGFLYYGFVTLSLAIVFVSYIWNTPLAGSMGLSGWLYFVPGALSHAALLALVPFLLSLPFLFIGKRKALYAPVFITLSAILLIFFVANGKVYSLYRFHINEFVLDMLFGGAAGDVFQFDTALYAKVGMEILLLAAAMIAIWFLCRRIFNRFNYVAAKPIITVLFLSLLFSHLFHAYSAAAKIPGVIRSALAIPYNAPLTANRLMLKMGVISKQDMTLNIGGGENSGLNYPLSPIEAQPDSIQKNIVLIAIDSWNKNAWNGEVSPNIWKFSERCSEFEDHLSSGNGTTGSLIGMFFSLPASYKDDLDISGTQPLLVNQLIANGYDVEAYGSASLVHPPFGRMMFSNVPDLRIESEGNTVYDRDCDITNDFISYINNKEEDKPFFSFLFYDLAHGCEMPAERNHPFKPAWDYPDYLKLNNDLDPTPFWNLYRNSLFQIDSLVGRVLTKLEEKNLLEKTVVIITGDHGQEFNENKKNYWGHGSNFSPVQIRIPFMIFDADKAKQIYRHRTTHYDVAPTLLKEYLGVKNPIEELGIGHLITDSCNRDWHYVGDYGNYAFVIDSDMRVLEKEHSGFVEVYDSLVNPIDNYKYDHKKLNDKIIELNRFYK